MRPKDGECVTIRARMTLAPTPARCARRDTRRLAASFVVLGMAGTMTPSRSCCSLRPPPARSPPPAALRSVWSETLGEDRHAAYVLRTVRLGSTYIAGPLLAGILIAA